MSKPRNKPIDLSKCKVGQRVRLRNGDIAKISRIQNPSQDKYPIELDTGSWHEKNGKLCMDDRQRDIVAILPPAEKEKKPAKKEYKEGLQAEQQNVIRDILKLLKGLLKP